MGKARRYLGWLVCLVFCMILFAGCGRENGEDGRTGYSVVRKEEEEIPAPGGAPDGRLRLLSRQFYHGEVVQICAVRDADGRTDICLYREDGAEEVLYHDAPSEYNAPWFIDDEGRRYVMPIAPALLLLGDDGEEAWRLPWEEDMVEDICQLSDGRLLLLTKGAGGTGLAELDPDTGRAEKLDGIPLAGGTQFIGGGGKMPLLLDGDGVWEVSLRDGSRECLMPFGGTYSPGAGVEDFRMLDDGRVQVVRQEGKLQTLELYDPSGGREIIVARKGFFTDKMKEYAVKFNEGNGKYYVVLEEAWDDAFEDRTAVELAAGKGPDIIGSGAADEQMLIEKGILEDLAPWMEASGIREEDFFPAAFSSMRDGERIYGVNMQFLVDGFWLDGELLGENREPDIGELVEMLLSREGGAVLCKACDAEWVLGFFLEGSEDLWGIVDWEDGKCSFDGGLFAGMMEAAKRYGDSGEKELPALGGIVFCFDYTYYEYEYMAKLREEEGKVEVGYLFDDGWHIRSNTYYWLAVNSSSPHKEGAWEFLRFLLSEQVQETVQEGRRYDYNPVNKAAYDAYAKRAIAMGVNVPLGDGSTAVMVRGSGNFLHVLDKEEYREAFSPTEEKVARHRAMLEGTRSNPLRVKAVLPIIYEEAADYFSGTKSLEEVCGIIQNRVQLYLDEKK